MLKWNNLVLREEVFGQASVFGIQTVDRRGQKAWGRQPRLADGKRTLKAVLDDDGNTPSALSRLMQYGVWCAVSHPNAYARMRGCR
mmetsp:Transcript_63439/g.141473  ORF Transcript_63439/g.141473 Transcript_63439/m.141473 type:complete len:86 (-) Transcript_63439:196-453(-)